ncbi:DUF2690 domain-containing protein [Streptomyces roseolus]|uniref:DUF2690 domain-containing protein n=1 Tax=Streptomyces roseolus TaxID=67358 RepID=UPI0033CA28A5
MSAWKALSGELDPDVRTFAERLRLVIDRSGLGVAAVAERTGHARADWDAYANAARPVPRSAVVALSDVTGADLGPLTAHWEHADRAWKRLLRERAVPEAPEAGAGAAVRERGPAPEDAPADRADPGGPAVPATSADPAAPVVPAVQTAPAAPADAADAADRTMRIRPVPPAPAAGPSAARAPRRASPLLYVAGIVGAALVVIAAVLLVDLGGTGKAPAAAPPPPATTTAPTPGPSLPEGVRCTGADCGGLDPEDMGCGGPLATTVARARVGTALVEVRHSEACAAAWARISGGAPGDEVSVQAGTAVRVAYVLADGDGGAYTAMIPVPSGGAARACAALTGGEDGCTGG